MNKIILILLLMSSMKTSLVFSSEISDLMEMQQRLLHMSVNDAAKETWSDDGNERILSIAIQSEKPLDIKIEKRMITIKGESKTKNSISTFSRSFSLPDDIDCDHPKFENKKNEIKIRFKKVGSKIPKVPKESKESKERKEKIEDGRIPIEKNSHDQVI